MSTHTLFLAQSYQDALDEYRRVLLSDDRPRWDYVILTASNDQQAEGFRKQLEVRRDFLPGGTVFAVIPDEGGVRVGSGGATLSVLKYIREREKSFDGLRILVIHSGGDSKRVPQYSALGKLFSPVPHAFGDRSSTLFDEFMVAMSAVPGRIPSGMLLLSGDVLLLFNPLLIDYSGRRAAVISFKENVQTGKDHGVFLRGEDGYVRRFMHKQTVEALSAAGAVNERNEVDIDTGAIIFSTDMLDALYGMITSAGAFSPEKYKQLVNDRVRLSLYGDFQYPLAADSTLEQFYMEQPEGTMCAELRTARTRVWEALRPFRMKLLRLAPAKFIHFGTSREILGLMTRGLDEYADLGWTRQVNCSFSGTTAGYNSVLSTGRVGQNVYLETSYVHSAATVGSRVILSYIDIHDETVPDGVILHGLKQRDGQFVCRIYGIEDNPKQEGLFSVPLVQWMDRMGIRPEELWEEDEPRVLWTARLYPECAGIREAIAAALNLYALFNGGGDLQQWRSAQRKSLCSGFNDADPDAIIAWNRRMAELVRMDRIAKAIAGGRPARELSGFLGGELTPIQREWLSGQIRKASGWQNEMRLHFYAGTALGGPEGEKETEACFSTLSKAILESTMAGLTENQEARIRFDRKQVELPLRVNWGGGWSDTPPYCNEHGGTVLNAAIRLNGSLPVSVVLERIPESAIVFDSRDMDVHGEFRQIGELQRTGDPYDPFALQKAALLACGILPARGGDLSAILHRMNGGTEGGFIMRSEVTGVPKGSGLGTSSILAGACVKCLFDFFGIAYDEDKLYTTVLAMEQIMSTGGGWQDQVGGLTPGIKYTTSRPGLDQKIHVSHVKLDPGAESELKTRFALIYTGQRRLARNLLRDVVGRYVGNEKDSLYSLNEIQRVAALMRFELERGNVDAFAELLDRHWELSRMVDAGSTNILIDQIFESIEDLIDGKMICGAGGGGFLQVIMKKGVSTSDLHIRLKNVFADSDVDVWNCELI